jgi:hypothetical protein
MTVTTLENFTIKITGPLPYLRSVQRTWVEISDGNERNAVVCRLYLTAEEALAVAKALVACADAHTR